MEHDSLPPPSAAPHARACRPFYPVPTRTRRDGWTVQRQADFLGMLAETGSVMGACEAVGMSRKSAYALRARPGAESFAAAWDAALGAPVRKVTAPDLDFLALRGPRPPGHVPRPLSRIVGPARRFRAAAAGAAARSRRRRGDTVSPEW